MKTQLYLLVSVLCGFTSHAQTPEQVEALKKELLTACVQKNPHQFAALFSSDAVTIEGDKSFMELWRKIGTNPKVGKIQQLKFFSKSELEKLADEGSSDRENYRLMYDCFDETEMIERDGLCYNVQPVGLLRVSFVTESLDLHIATRNGRLCLPWFRPATQKERADAHLTAERRNPSLLSLKDAIDSANKLGKQVSLVVVTRGAGDKLMINRKEVAMTAVEEFVRDLVNKEDDEYPIILVDCGSETEKLMHLLDAICDKWMPSDFTLLAYRDARHKEGRLQDPAAQSISKAKQQGADQPAAQPADIVPAKVEPIAPTSKDGPR